MSEQTKPNRLRETGKPRVVVEVPSFQDLHQELLNQVEAHGWQLFNLANNNRQCDIFREVTILNYKQLGNVANDGRVGTDVFWVPEELRVD